MKAFINNLPKAELHLHIEGTFEPALIFEIGKRNNVSLSYPSVEALSKAYAFNNLQEFLDIYYEGANVLLKEADFFDLTMAYFQKAHNQNVRHCEIMFDPQTHTERGVPFEYVIKGINRACIEAREKLGITSFLIMSFLRHLSEESGFLTLEEGIKYKDLIHAVGLDSSELGNPPSKFYRLFEKAAQEGFKIQAHAGEEGPAEYIWEALKMEKFERIDHGNACLTDDKLVALLKKEQIPLTVCPLSNIKLCVVDKIENHPIKKMLDLGLLVTVNSDDPPYFGGYMNENFEAIQEGLGLSQEELGKLARNGFVGSYLDSETKEKYLNELDGYLANHK